jgi:ATP-binding cassette subfamily B protein
VLRADRLVVIDRGVIVEEGRHQDLLASEGVYSRLYRGQFRPADVLVG